MIISIVMFGAGIVIFSLLIWSDEHLAKKEYNLDNQNNVRRSVERAVKESLEKDLRPTLW